MNQYIIGIALSSYLMSLINPAPVIGADIVINDITRENSQLNVGYHFFNNGKKNIFLAQLCLKEQESPHLCYEKTTVVIPQKESGQLIFDLRDVGPANMIKVFDLFLRKIEKDLPDVSPQKIRSIEGKVAYQDNGELVEVTLLVHKAPINISVLSEDKSIVHQQSILSTGSHIIRVSNKQNPLTLVYSSVYDQGSLIFSKP